MEVDDAAEAVRILPSFGKTAFLSTGFEALESFMTLAQRMRLVLRTMERLSDLPSGVVTIQGRPPFELGHEVELLRRYGVDVLVSKASGGSATEAKIVAARQLGLPVVMMRRPPLPEGPLASDVDGALDWLSSLGP